MGFIGYMLCVVVALFLGIILDRLIIKSREESEDYEYACVSFKEEKTAENVLSALKDVLEDNGVIRVYDYYILSRTGKGTADDFRFGWTDLGGFSIDNSDGFYVLSVPVPQLLKK